MRRMVSKICIILTMLIFTGTVFVSCGKEKGENLATKAELTDFVLSEFESIMPEAKIFDFLICDIDGNELEDYIILFSKASDTNPVAAGLSVCLDDSMWSGIDLASGTDFAFCSAPSVRFEDAMPIISVKIQDTKSNIEYLYEVEFSYDSKSREANYSIKTDILGGSL